MKRFEEVKFEFMGSNEGKIATGVFIDSIQKDRYFDVLSKIDVSQFFTIPNFKMNNEGYRLLEQARDGGLHFSICSIFYDVTKGEYYDALIENADMVNLSSYENEIVSGCVCKANTSIRPRSEPLLLVRKSRYTL